MGPISRAPALPERWRDPCFMRRCRQQVHDRGNRQVHGFRGRGARTISRSCVLTLTGRTHWSNGSCLAWQTTGTFNCCPFLSWWMLDAVGSCFYAIPYCTIFFQFLSYILSSFHIVSSFPDFTEVGWSWGHWSMKTVSYERPKDPKSSKTMKKIEKHVICFNVKHCKSVKPSKIKAY